MPDISRSDSNRSDASRPRVSFNRDVHVKRINGPRTANAYSLSSDGSTFVPTSVRRERPRTKKEMTEEAEAVLKQVDKLSCTASSNVKLDEDKPKVKKKRKESFLKSFSWKNDKSKASSSDVDSSSQEYRVYRVNSPANAKPGKGYDFMSLDRKKLKKEKKNKNLEYLSLERNDENFDKMWKAEDKRNTKSVMAMVFDKPNDVIEVKAKPKLVCNIPDEQTLKKKQLSPIIESPRVDYFDGKKENNIDKMIKKLTEKNIPKLSKNTGPIGVKAPQSDNCHNENKPFSYTNGLADKLGLDGTITESLDGKEDLKSTSPTSDVIYAQVLVSGREGNVQKTTVHSRVASNEVGRVVGESNQSQVGLDYKTEAIRNDGFYETVNGDDMWKTKSDFNARLSPQEELYGENPGRRELYRRRSNDIAASPTPGEDYVKTIRVAPKYDPPGYRKSPSDLRDLSIRREILLSRSESQAKERYNSLKRLQEPAGIKRRVSSANGVRPTPRSEVRYLGDDTRINDLYATSLRKIPKDVELIQPVRTRRETKPLETKPVETKPVEAKPAAKDQSWKGFGKSHTIVTDNPHTKIGKSKSFMEDKPKKKMDKVKMLFKKKGKGSESEDDPLSSRYIEYRGSDLELSDRSTDSSPRRSTSNLHYTEEVVKKQRVVPNQSSPKMGTLTRLKNNKNKESHWLKPADKATNKAKQKNRVDDVSSDITTSSKPAGLRFFGDTDQESTTDFSELKYKYGLHRGGKVSDSDEDPLIIPTRSESRMTDSTLKGSTTGKYKSKYDLDRPDYGLKQMNYGLKMDDPKDDYINSNLSDTSTLKNLNYDYDLNGLRYGPSITRSLTSVTPATKKEKLRNLKSNPVITVTEPEESLSRRVKSHGNLYSHEEPKRGRRRTYDSESTTEGDSSQHSSKSMIYLHAATVGDIPGPRNVYRSERRSQSREELSSISDGTVLAPNKKTLSRSFSVLAPWRPKHYKEDRILYYDTGVGVDNIHGKPPAGPVKNKRSLSRERKHNELQFNTLGKENRRRKDLIR
ncbi:UNVERIFIED_CONTAM: hypothetical protein PYX00_004327 [Menopon gallinae]|uniref:Uncharacterized protein n=1 Tax=Menopon gallinae TaxID=328185 RepID=A0AAW2I5V5_9NEOP